MTPTLIAILVVLLLLAALRLWLTANRLDRLHVRTEAAWNVLVGALSRRVVAARALAAAGGLPPERSALLRGLARQADTAPREHRAAAENELSRALAALPASVPADLRGELADAQERLTLARSFYNDAVRDTRLLRESWFPRFFRLAGSASLPEYFQIIDDPFVDVPESGPDAGAAPTSAPEPSSAAAPAPVSPEAPWRRSGRVVLLDSTNRVLLFHGSDPGRPGDPGWWITPGGGLEPGEDEAAGAVRELAEETGLRVETADLVGPIWVRQAEFEFMGEVLRSRETFYGHRVRGDDWTVDTSGFTDQERDTMDAARWWTADELAALPDQVYPTELAARLGEVILAVDRAAGGGGSPADRGLALAADAIDTEATDPAGRARQAGPAPID